MDHGSARLWRAGLTVALVCLVVACGGGGGGGSAGGGGTGGSGSNPPPATPPPPAPSAPNAAPTISILATGQVAALAGDPILHANVGSELSLSGATSTDAERDILTFKWTVVAKPATSTLTLASDATAVITFTPDTQGTYELMLRVTDTKGAWAEKSASILVDNSAPVPAVVVTATYSAEPTTAPTQIISAGAGIVLDASSSTDVDGDPVTTSWSLLDKPAGSVAALTINGQTARFTADLQGIYKVKARGQDPYGAYAETIYVFDARNRAPNPVLLATVSPVQTNSGQNTVNASTGYDVVLNGSGSSDPDGDSFTRSWSLQSKPTGSAVQLGSTTGVSVQFTPDIKGNYVVRLTTTDSSGASAFYTTTVAVNNARPVANISTNATPSSLPSAPSIRVPVNTQLTLRGSGSSDADGQALTYAWSVVTRPAGSLATIGSASSVTANFTPDVSGSYVIRLRVTDTAAAFSERTLTIDIGNYPPVAVIDKNRVTVLSGTNVAVSASLSYDEDGDPLTYSWAVDARPAGSTATIASSHSANLTFTPDRPGTYAISVTVNDGRASNVAYFTVRSLSSVSGSVALPFVPLSSQYSKGLDKLILIAANPNALKIVDPFVGSIKTVVLPWSVKGWHLSPDGKLAAVLHEGQVSLVDLQTAQLVRTSLTGGSQTDVFLLNDGVAYLIGQTGGQWVSPPITILDTRTGTTLPAPDAIGFAFFYGTQKGVFADKKNRVLFMAYGLSPADISWFTIDPAAHSVVAAGDSPYHGDYSLGDTFYLSGNQDLLFTSAGTYFHTETLTYAGRLQTSSPIQSMSQSSAVDEALVLEFTLQGSYPYTTAYPSAYKRFYGALFLADNDIPLPQIAGQQSYGISIFHSANDEHVALVQTGSATALDSQAQYHVIYR
jgi:hypothetical protein